MPAKKRAPESSEDDSLKLDHGCSAARPEDGDADESDRSTSSSSNGEKDEFIVVKLSDIRKEVQCPICLGIIRKTRTVMECLHRFCRECIDKSMRLGNNECPACRTHCASRRSLRDDPNYDSLIAALYPDIEKYEEDELAFREEERIRNKQIQASIAQTLRRQSEAVSKKRPPSVRRLRGNNYRNSQSKGKRSYRNDAEFPASDDNEDPTAEDGVKDSSSDEQMERSERRSKGFRKQGAAKFSQPPFAACSDGAGEDNDSDQVNREILSASSRLVGNSERLVWGKGGMRSHTRHGCMSVGSSKNVKNNRISTLVDSLRTSDNNAEEREVCLLLFSYDQRIIPSLQLPYICCRPTSSVRHLCQYVAGQTGFQADEIDMFLIQELNLKIEPSTSIDVLVSKSLIPHPIEDHFQVLREQQTLAELKTHCSTRGQLLLAYQKKPRQSQ
ncbi:putative E3 ubiquitin-protein ligase RING1a [Cucurbita pepo subsp. pepo]|uniref:E3 ubiquitin-protein ligase RING1a n=1 Tax=Cucurbita moschata TaxID=3662 RepID=A0A6J1ENS0_CUCMO|nr:putative E3 ubiquitin-protein ligase RING1a [Cucurbita moschata]XP_023519096.1 putative E3 ubiquitin-protein ligase RING1a [Cucurbita pepo subsp. pepo]